MTTDFHEQHIPRFYGATTVGERGQVVIPAEARRDFGIEHATKLLVFGVPHGNCIFLAKAEAITELMARTMSILTRIEESING